MGRPVPLGPPAPKRQIVIDREELAWAAGFFDGEGCTSNRVVSGNPYPGLSLNQVEPAPLQRFHKAINGLGRIYGPYGPPKSQPNRRPIYSWQCYKFEEAQAVIAMLWAFLSTPKREQYKRALARAKENEFWGSGTYAEKQSARTTARWAKFRAAQTVKV